MNNDMKVIILGSTGMVGKGVLLECLDDSDIEQVLVVNRQTCNIQHIKLNEVIHKDFFSLSTIKSKLKGFDACYFCLGVSSAGMTEEKYNKITYELTLNFARIFIELNPDSVFCYVSGVGTDSSEKGRTMWARIKGKTENALLAMPFKAAYMFRPGYIQPGKGIRSKTPLYRIFYILLTPFYYLFKPFKSLVTNTKSLGKAMINVTKKGSDKNILGVRDINILAKL
jgi:uncharacterized protein YbjT (DUF2867 family)